MTYLTLTLFCKYDLAEHFQRVNNSVPLGAFTSGSGSPLILRQSEIVTWNYELCQPQFSIEGLTGYLGRYKMVSVQQLELTSKNISVVVGTNAVIQCTRGFSDDNYFNIKVKVE